MVKMVRVLYLASILLLSKGILFRQTAPGKSTTSAITLREWLRQGRYHVALAPMYSHAILLHSTILSMLEQYGLDHISSMSGCSDGGTAAAMWASRDSDEHSLATYWGKNLTKSECELRRCNIEEQMYLNFLDLPVLGEKEPLSSIASPALLKQWSNHFITNAKRTDQPSHNESLIAWSSSSWNYRNFHIKKFFNETKIPLVIPVFDFVNKRNLLLSKGDLQLAQLATASPPGTAELVEVSGMLVTDGYFGDGHGASGYDSLAATDRSPRILNIVPVDVPGQAEPMNWTQLQEHKHLEEAVTIFVSAGQTLINLAIKLAQAGKPYVQNKHILHATLKHMLIALDKPMQRVTKSHVNEYVVSIDLAEDLPRPNAMDPNLPSKIFSEIRTKVAGFDETLAKYGTVEEAIDTSGILQDADLKRAANAYDVALKKMLGGEQSEHSNETTSSMSHKRNQKTSATRLGRENSTLGATGASNCVWINLTRSSFLPKMTSATDMARFDEVTFFSGAGNLMDLFQSGYSSVTSSGAIFLVNTSSGLATEVEMSAFPTKDLFQPQGMFFSKLTWHLYVANHAGLLEGDRIEVFKVDVADSGLPTLKYMMSISSALFQNMAVGDVIEGDGDIYVISWLPVGYPPLHGRDAIESLPPAVQQIWNYSAFKDYTATKVYRCEIGSNAGASGWVWKTPSKCEVAADGFKSAKHITISPDRQKVFVNEGLSSIIVFKRLLSGKLEKTSEIFVSDVQISGIEYDEYNDIIWAGIYEDVSKVWDAHQENQKYGEVKTIQTGGVMKIDPLVGSAVPILRTNGTEHSTSSATVKNGYAYMGCKSNAAILTCPLSR